MPVICHNTSAFSTSEPEDMTTVDNISSIEDPTPTTHGISDPGDPLVYILAVLSFYVLSITLLMAKSIHGGRDEKNYDDYFKPGGAKNNGYMPSVFLTKTKLPKSSPPPPKSPETSQKIPQVSFATPLTGQPARTALKKPHAGTRPKTKETVRLIEPSEIERIRALGKKDKRKKHSHQKLEPVLMTSV